MWRRIDHARAHRVRSENRLLDIPAGQRMHSLHFLWFLGLGLGLRLNEFVVRTNQYLRNFDDDVPRFGTLPAWYQPQFNDSKWASGPTPIGKCTGATDLCSVMGGDAHGKSSIYIRKAIDINRLGSADLDIAYDDSFVAYVNGIEVSRAYAGPPGYPMSSEQSAFWTRNPTSTSVNVTDELMVGKNVLAIQVNRWSSQRLCSVNAQLIVDGTVVIPLGSDWQYHPGTYEPSGGLIDHSYFEYELGSVGTTKSTGNGGSSVPVDPIYYEEAKLDFLPWIELYNEGNETVFLGDYSLTNSMDRPGLYRITFGLLNPGLRPQLTPQGEAMIFIPSGADSIFEYVHTNFEVNAYKGYIGLRDPQGRLVDELTYGEENVSTWHSTGRDPSGAWVVYGTPTPGRPNTGSSYVAVARKPDVSPLAGMFPSAITVTVSCATSFTAWITFNGEEPWPSRGNSTRYQGTNDLDTFDVLAWPVAHRA